MTLHTLQLLVSDVILVDARVQDRISAELTLKSQRI